MAHVHSGRVSTGDPTRKVVMTFHEGTIGGATKSVLRAVPELQRLGWDPVFWVDRPSDLYDWLAGEGYVVDGRRRAVGFSRTWLRRPPGLRKLRDTPGWLAGFARFVRHHRPAVVHANSLYTAPEALIARALGVPAVLHVHEMLPDNAKARLARTTIRRAGLEPIAVSRASARRLAGEGAPLPRIVHESAPVPEAPGPRAANGGPPVVGTVGWVCPRKGTDLFVEAARHIRADRPGVEFRLVGPYVEESHDYPWARRVLDEAARDGIRHWRQADVYAQLREWDVFVLPSRFDPFPLVVLEAMASEVPVVCTAVDGMVEQVEGGGGLLAAPEDPADIAAKVIELLDDPARRRAMGAAGRRSVAASFTPAHQAAGLASAYAAVARA